MSKFKFVRNSAGFIALMKSEAMQEILIKHASAAKSRAGDGYDQDIFVGKTRANAMVWADTVQAKKDNLENNTLLKAVR